MKNEFNKIMLLNGITNSLISFGINSGNSTLEDYIDMNCGALPEGDFSQVIDPEAPEQFISLYTGIVQKRFAFTVMALIKMNPQLEKAIEDFMFRVGEDMKIPSVNSREEAEKTVQAFVIQKTPKAECKAAGGTLEIYFKMMQSFVNGLLNSSEYKVELPLK